MADALVLGTSIFGCEGSNPFWGTHGSTVGPPGLLGGPWHAGDAGDPALAAHMEASHSGLVRTPGKRVGCKPSRVQIPPPPLTRWGVIARPGGAVG